MNTAPRDPASLIWRKSSYSRGNGGDCVEVAVLPGGGPAIRDSERLFQQADLRAHPGPGRLREHPGIAFPGHQRGYHNPAPTPRRCPRPLPTA
ncbi:MAG: DUF397 domain-containing protein [Pseudonocardia sp.]